IWITQAYVLGSTVALLLVGRISDIVGRVKLYTSGFGVFTLGSLLTSLAVNPAQVIAFRAIQGLGSAILFTNSAAMIVDATPADAVGPVVPPARHSRPRPEQSRSHRRVCQRCQLARLQRHSRAPPRRHSQRRLSRS